jgi:hypothetical protein
MEKSIKKITHLIIRFYLLIHGYIYHITKAGPGISVHCPLIIKYRAIFVEAAEAIRELKPVFMRVAGYAAFFLLLM